jgi:DNA polymerase
MLVGEQPGDREDVVGRPFVGPAGGLLDRAFEEVGLDRSQVYLTNAVKHFKNEERGKRRLHKRPNQYEIDRCRWWLDRELAIVKPKVLLALGATAAKILVGRAVKVGKEPAKPIGLADGRTCLVTIHPSAILRMRDDKDRRAALARLKADIVCANRLAQARPDSRR